MQVSQKAGALLKRAGVAVALAGSSVAAFAQTSGSSALFSDTAITSSINSVAPILIDVGGATLAVVCVAWGFKMVRGFLGR